jgi:hypothetical protein
MKKRVALLHRRKDAHTNLYSSICSVRHVTAPCHGSQNVNVLVRSHTHNTSTNHNQQNQTLPTNRNI